jgi:hypothetical protein
VFRKAGQWVVVAMLSLALGLHWTLLQSVAWIGMLASYSSQASWSEAVRMTFDGQHPCSLCKQVAAGKKSERDPQSHPSGKPIKIEGYLPVVPLLSFYPVIDQLPSPQPLCVHSRGLDSPPTPPPRAV